MTDQTRTSHPYFMFDNMLAQPEAWGDVIARNRALVRDFALGIAKRPRVILAGIGTSFHAAWAAEFILRQYAGDLDFRAVNSFDLALYGPQVRASDAVIVISHRGTKGYSVMSLQRAREAVARTALITGQGADLTASGGLTDTVFYTVPQEKSSAHTYSYVGSVAVLSALAQELGILNVSDEKIEDRFLMEVVPQSIRDALGTNSEIAGLAREFASARRIFIVGGGPAAIVAHEIGLKIKETSYSPAEGIMTETMLHGHFQGSESEDAFILVAPTGAAQSRTMQLTEMIHDIGARYAIVSDTPRDDPGALAWIQTPPVPESFSAVTCMIPLQLFSYQLALIKGTNPDIFRRDDERFDKATARIKL